MIDEHIAKLYDKTIKSQIKEDQYAGLPKWAYTPEEVSVKLDKLKDGVTNEIDRLKRGISCG